jgi:hypothetical protein
VCRDRDRDSSSNRTDESSGVTAFSGGLSRSGVENFEFLRSSAVTLCQGVGAVSDGLAFEC